MDSGVCTASSRWALRDHLLLRRHLHPLLGDHLLLRYHLLLRRHLRPLLHGRLLRRHRARLNVRDQLLTRVEPPGVHLEPVPWTTAHTFLLHMGWRSHLVE